MVGRVTECGERLATRWEAAHWDHLRFPQLACELLAEHELHRDIDSETIARAVVTRKEVPPQPNLDSAFGQPPVTLFTHPKFYIEALHWTTGSTHVHQHGFSGAFCVVVGGSLESTYRFTCTDRVNAQFMFGELKLVGTSKLDVGAVRPIASGETLIHAAYHLASPSITLVARTYADLGSAPQLDYHYPAIAIDPHYSDALGFRRSQMLAYLRRVGSAQFVSLAQHVLGDADPVRVYKVLSSLAPLCDEATIHQLARTVEDRHGARGHLMWKCVHEGARQRVLLRARERVVDEHTRFFLALLMNVRSRAELLEAVAREYPTQVAVEWVLERCFALSPNEAGLEFNVLSRALFRHLIEGHTSERVIALLRSEFTESDLGRLGDDIRSQCERLRRESVFMYLLEQS